MKAEERLEEGKGIDSPSQLIDAGMEELSDWRGDVRARTKPRATFATLSGWRL
jgi:hypothetical protein